MEACIVDPDTKACYAPGDDSGWLALQLRSGSQCATEVVEGSTVLSADPATGAWPSMGSYRVSDCTGDTTTTWSLAVSSRFNNASFTGFKSYRLVVQLQGVGLLDGAANLASEIINVTESPITRGVDDSAQVAYALDCYLIAMCLLGDCYLIAI